MEELVVLIIFGLIILFNFILKKLAGATSEKERKRDAAPAESTGYSAPTEDVKEFLQEIKRRAEEAQAGHSQSQMQAHQLQQQREEAARRQRALDVRKRKEHAARQRAAQLEEQKKKKPASATGKASEKTVRQKVRQKTPAGPGGGRAKPGIRTAAGLERLVGLNRAELRRAVVMSEVLGQPIGMRDMQ